MNTILKVRLGEYDVSTTAEPLKHEEFNISDIVIHPGFNNSTLVHDIALLRLEKPAKRKQVRNHQDSVIPIYTFFCLQEKSKHFFPAIYSAAWSFSENAQKHCKIWRLQSQLLISHLRLGLTQ